MDDIYAINAAKTELREGYNTADVDRILSLFGGLESRPTARLAHRPVYGQ